MPEPGLAREACPFCGERIRAPFGERAGRRYARCRGCASIYADLAPARYATLHGSAFQDDEFLARIEENLGSEPNSALWDYVLEGRQGPGRVLEIGPGSGHLLAAATQGGWEAVAVESSAHHRDYIRKTWGLEQVHANLGDLPTDATFDLILLVNVLEHVFEVAPLMTALGERLTPGGEIFVSLPNARCLIASLFGTRWSMFKPADHVSLPSPAGLRALGARAGLRIERLWSSELPLETLVGAVVAWRDRREAGPSAQAEPLPPAPAPGGFQRRMLGRINAMNPRHEPLNRLMGWMGRAATLKCRYRRA